MSATRGGLRLRPALAGLSAALWALLLVWAGASPASAHAQLVSSTPAEGTVVGKAPESVELEFNERVQVHPEDTRVFVGDGSEIDSEAVSTDRTVTVTPSSDLTEGTVVVSYSITSADGHRINGSVTFAVGAPTPGSSSNDVFEEPATTGVGAAFTVSWVVALLAGAGLVLLALFGLVARRTPGSETAGPGGDWPDSDGSASGEWAKHVREVLWPVGLVAGVLAIPLSVVHRGGFGWSGLVSWEHWIDGFVTWRGLLVLLGLLAAAVAVTALRRTAAVVAVVAAMVMMGVGAASVAAPGADPVPVTGVPAGEPVAEATSGDTTVRVTFESLMVGTTGLTLEVLDADGKPVEPYAAPQLRLHSDRVNLGDIALKPGRPGVWSADVTLPETGEWTVEVSLRVDEFTNPVLELPFDVGRPPGPADGAGGGH